MISYNIHFESNTRQACLNHHKYMDICSYGNNFLGIGDGVQNIPTKMNFKPSVLKTLKFYCVNLIVINVSFISWKMKIPSLIITGKLQMQRLWVYIRY